MCMNNTYVNVWIGDRFYEHDAATREDAENWVADLAERQAGARDTLNVTYIAPDGTEETETRSGEGFFEP